MEMLRLSSSKLLVEVAPDGGQSSCRASARFGGTSTIIDSRHGGVRFTIQTLIELGALRASLRLCVIRPCELPTDKYNGEKELEPTRKLSLCDSEEGTFV